MVVYSDGVIKLSSDEHTEGVWAAEGEFDITDKIKEVVRVTLLTQAPKSYLRQVVLTRQVYNAQGKCKDLSTQHQAKTQDLVIGSAKTPSDVLTL